ncbi:MAG: trypsin-like peptidase domain-containing protein [Planctomycetales bacterium]|nr:trypsin-like peptidase domain-containing protein [Planctomycetales bacterium]
MRNLARSWIVRRLGAAALLAVAIGTIGSGTLAASELRRSAVVRAVQEARQSVVNIHGQKTLSSSYDEFGHVESPKRVNGMGTGVVIDSRGYIVTNHHVVQGVRRIEVTLWDGSNTVAQLIAYDPQTDLAIIKIDVKNELPVITLGSSNDLMPGEDVIAVGNAFGYEHTVTRGIISALKRTVQVSDSQQYEDLIQTDASINPGNSGGPLLNIDGEMIGLNVAVRAGAQGIGFAIPVDKVLDVAGDLLTVEKVDRHWHGLHASAASDGNPGAQVTRIDDGSPAADSGLKRGDVIVEVDRLPVQRKLDVERAMLGRKAGEEIDLVVRRDGQRLNMSLVLGEPSRGPQTTEQRAWNVLGMRLRRVSAGQLEQYNSRYRGGLLVTDVREESPAARQGIRSGDILVGMHIWETVSLDNVAYVLNRSDLAELEPLKFYIVRSGETLFGHLSVAQLRR